MDIQIVQEITRSILAGWAKKLTESFTAWTKDLRNILVQTPNPHKHYLKEIEGIFAKGERLRNTENSSCINAARIEKVHALSTMHPDVMPHIDAITIAVYHIHKMRNNHHCNDFLKLFHEKIGAERFFVALAKKYTDDQEMIGEIDQYIAQGVACIIPILEMHLKWSDERIVAFFMSDFKVEDRFYNVIKDIEGWDDERANTACESIRSAEIQKIHTKLA